jgi:hypothetical protein
MYPPTFVFGPVLILLRKFDSAAPVIPPVGLLIPVCAAALVPTCAPTFVFGAVIVLLRKFSWAALAEFTLKLLCPAVAPVAAPV